MNKITFEAYAKINPYLDVISKRHDGYHNILSIMQTVSLCDEITVSIDGCDGICIECSDIRLPYDSRNLAYKAARAYLDAVSENVGVKIVIKKNIPFEAGLGGGSADAAAVLRAMNILFENRLDEIRLSDIGLKIGADVPFCLVGGTAVVRGIGEVIEPLRTDPDYCVAISIDGKGMSTPEAFGMLDIINNGYAETDPASQKRFDRMTELYINSDTSEILRSVYNAFEDVVFSVRPAARTLRDAYIELGADAAVLSGSGPSVIALFRDRDKAASAVRSIQKRKIAAWLTHIVNY